MDQLIIFRVFQGIGASGGAALTMLITYEIVPPEKIPLYGTFMSVSISMATVIGPLLGGGIVSGTIWRWVFYFK